MSGEPSTIATLGVPMAKALESYGCDSKALFEQAGVDFAAIGDPNKRYPVSAMSRLWELAIEATGDSCLGLVVSRFVHPTAFHALGFSWLASRTLRDVFVRLERYHRIATNASAVRLQEALGEYRVIIDFPVRGYRPKDEAIDTFVAVLVRLCRFMYRRDFHPLRLEMQRKEPDRAHEFTSFFQTTIEFSAPQNRLFFDKRELHAPLATANAELARINDQAAAEYLARLDRSNFTARVQAELYDQLPMGEPDRQSIAQALHTSVRNLQRRLREENTTYKEILDRTRRELGLQYIQEPRYSIGEIAYLLGFSEPANFSRAFKRWTGIPPGKYRLSP